MTTKATAVTDQADQAGSEGILGTGISIPTTEIREAVDSVARSVPDVARGSRTLMEDAMQGIERSSDERVAAGVTMSLGLAVGMLIGGAPRLLTVLALLPVAAFGLVLMDRRNGSLPTRAARPS
jgi:hypothetical protein